MKQILIYNISKFGKAEAALKILVSCNYAFKRFPNNLAFKVPNSIPTNPPFCAFASFLIVLLTPLSNKPDSSSDLNIFIISMISSLEIITVVTLIEQIVMCSYICR